MSIDPKFVELKADVLRTNKKKGEGERTMGGEGIERDKGWGAGREQSRLAVSYKRRNGDVTQKNRS